MVVLSNDLSDTILFKKSFNRIVREPTEKLEDMPLIAALSMDQLEKDIEESTVIPLICKHCGAIADYNKLEKKNKTTYSRFLRTCLSSRLIFRFSSLFSFLLYNILSILI